MLTRHDGDGGSSSGSCDRLSGRRSRSLWLLMDEDFQYFLPDLFQARIPGKSLSRHAIAFTDQPQQQMLGADVVMTELKRFTER